MVVFGCVLGVHTHGGSIVIGGAPGAWRHILPDILSTTVMVALFRSIRRHDWLMEIWLLGQQWTGLSGAYNACQFLQPAMGKNQPPKMFSCTPCMDGTCVRVGIAHCSFGPVPSSLEIPISAWSCEVARIHYLHPEGCSG